MAEGPPQCFRFDDRVQHPPPATVPADQHVLGEHGSQQLRPTDSGAANGRASRLAVVRVELQPK
jgi:hypothetical protein